MKISVVGTGYVGLVSGACFAEIGHDCICVDVDARKIEKINRGEAPIHENGLQELLTRHVGKRLSATSDLYKAVLETDVTFIAVGTPFDGEAIDLSYVRSAALEVGAALRNKDAYHAVVVKSTVVPGTTDDVVLPALEHSSGKKAGRDFGVGMNPEFLTEGVAVDDFIRPDRIVTGGIDKRTIDLQRRIYAPFADTPTVATNNKTAEMIKYVSNSVLATLISFSNEMADTCSAIGDVDVADVMRGVHLARYLTTNLADGRRVKAGISSFLWAGCGYGGSCLPKDTKALSAHSKALGSPMPLLDAVMEINRSRADRMINLVRKHYAMLSGLRVCLLGLAFKEDTDDMRESPSVSLAQRLLDAGAVVSGYDPAARETARAALPREVSLKNRIDEAIDSMDVLLIVTRWQEFQRLPELLAGRSAQPLVVDGRRMLAPESVQRYEGVGR